MRELENNVSLLERLANKTDLRNPDRNRLSSLSWAAAEGSLQVFEYLLLDYGHDDEELSRDADNNTILHLLASVPSSQPSTLPYTSVFPARTPASPLEQSRTSVQMASLYHTLFPFLLDWSNSGGKTALHIAAQSGHTAFLSLLLSLGADPDLTDLQGNSPLHYAAAWGHDDGARVLLAGGAAWGMRNFEGFTAGEYAFSEDVKVKLEILWEDVKRERQRRRREEEASAESQLQVSLRSGALYQTGQGNRWRSNSHSTAASGQGSNGGSAASGSMPSSSSLLQQSQTGARSSGNLHTRSPNERPDDGELYRPPQPQHRSSPRQPPGRMLPAIAGLVSVEGRQGSPQISEGAYATPRLGSVEPQTSSLTRESSGNTPQFTQDRIRVPGVSTPPIAINHSIEGISVRPPHPARSPSLPSSPPPSRLVGNVPTRVENDAAHTPAIPTTAGSPMVTPETGGRQQSGGLLPPPSAPDQAEQGMRRSHSAHVGLGLWGRLGRG